MPDLPHSPAAERNKQPILDALSGILGEQGAMLEIASGTGQHAVWFATALSGWTWQPTDADVRALPGIAARVERAELPNLPVASPEDRGASDRPDIERHLVEIWTELFARPIGPEDNFFDVGGNSLFAIRLSSKLRQRGLPAINPRDLYMHQTIARLSPVLARHPGI